MELPFLARARISMYAVQAGIAPSKECASLMMVLGTPVTLIFGLAEARAPTFIEVRAQIVSTDKTNQSVLQTASSLS